MSARLRVGGRQGWKAAFSPRGEVAFESGCRLHSRPQSADSALGQTDGQWYRWNEDIHVNITEQIDAQLDQKTGNRMGTRREQLGR